LTSIWHSFLGYSTVYAAVPTEEAAKEAEAATRQSYASARDSSSSYSSYASTRDLSSYALSMIRYAILSFLCPSERHTVLNWQLSAISKPSISELYAVNPGL